MTKRDGVLWIAKVWESSNRTIVARGEKLMRAEMMSFADVSGVCRPQAQLSGSHQQLSGSGSGIDVPLSTAKNRDLLLPRVSPLTTRYEGDNPGSCFVAVTARTMARVGRHRDPTPP